MLKASGDEGAQLIHDIIEIPTGWNGVLSSVSLWGKGARKSSRPQITRPGHYGSREGGREFLRQQMRISDIQVSFIPERSATDALFIVRQLQEQFNAVNKTLHMALSIWKRHSIVYPDVLCGGLFASSEWLVHPIQSMYKNTRSRVHVGCNNWTWVKSSVWKFLLEPPSVNHGPVSLFQEFYGGCPRESLSANDLHGHPNRWRNCKRSWSFVSLMWKEMVFGQNQDPDSWVGLFQLDPRDEVVFVELWSPTFRCKQCTGLARPVDGRTMTESTVGREKLGVMLSFCYLGVFTIRASGAPSSMQAKPWHGHVERNND